MPSVLLWQGKNNGHNGKGRKIQKKIGKKTRFKKEEKITEHGGNGKYQKRV
jgi:hypothetical protein